jgi:ABC-2 type transport system ATP-binding protein
MDDFAIRVHHVSKDFHYTSGRAGTIKSLLTSTFKNSEVARKDVQHALSDVSFNIKKGEFFGIVGRNGSGKSTLLKMIAGIYQPNSGKIKVSGKLVPFIELGVGFNPELTGRENVYLNGALLGFSRKEIEAQYDEIVEFAELEKFMDQQLKNYSSGMQVRLAFSMAVRARADVLLIDEVLAVGDADFQRKCFDYFKKLKKDSKTVVFISHDMSAVREYCDRVALIDKSKLVQVGSADTIAQMYTKLFGDSAKTQIVNTQNRWGSGDAKTMHISVVVKSEKIVIQQEIRSYKNIDGIIAGIKIREAGGKEITGTNNKIEQVTLPKLKENGKLTLVWELPNILSDGDYTIDPAILAVDGITVYDWWNDATNMAVRKDRHVPYSIDPGFKVTVSEELLDD